MLRIVHDVCLLREKSDYFGRQRRCSEPVRDLLPNERDSLQPHRRPAGRAAHRGIDEVERE